jgi:hypothetical protein
MLFNCTYLETKLIFYLYEKWSLTKMNFKCEEWVLFFFSQIILVLVLMMESLIFKLGAAFSLFMYFVFVVA